MPAVKNRALEQPSPTESNRNGVKELEVHVRKSNMSELKLLCVKNGVKFFQTDVLDWLSVTAGAPAEEEQEPAELPNPTDTHHTPQMPHSQRDKDRKQGGKMLFRQWRIGEYILIVQSYPFLTLTKVTLYCVLELKVTGWARIKSKGKFQVVK